MTTAYKEVSLNNKRIPIEIIDKKSGVREDGQGYYHPTYNCYAFLGYELDGNNKRTGRLIAGAGNNARGEVEYADDCKSLTDYLERWDSEWHDDFRAEGLLPD